MASSVSHQPACTRTVGTHRIVVLVLLSVLASLAVGDAPEAVGPATDTEGGWVLVRFVVRFISMCLRVVSIALLEVAMCLQPLKINIEIEACCCRALHSFIVTALHSCV